MFSRAPGLSAARCVLLPSTFAHKQTPEIVSPWQYITKSHKEQLLPQALVLSNPSSGAASSDVSSVVTWTKPTLSSGNVQSYLALLRVQA